MGNRPDILLSRSNKRGQNYRPRQAGEMTGIETAGRNKLQQNLIRSTDQPQPLYPNAVAMSMYFLNRRFQGGAIRIEACRDPPRRYHQLSFTKRIRKNSRHAFTIKIR